MFPAGQAATPLLLSIGPGAGAVWRRPGRSV